MIGFKLTSHLSEAEASLKVEKLMKTADFVVHNDLQDMNKIKGQHKFTLWGFKNPKLFENIEQLSVGLMEAISGEVKS